MADHKLKGKYVMLVVGLVLWRLIMVEPTSLGLEVPTKVPKGCNIELQQGTYPNLHLDCEIRQSNVNAVLFEIKQPQFSKIKIDIWKEFLRFQFGEKAFHSNLKSLYIFGDAFSITRHTFRELDNLENLNMKMFFNLDGILYKDIVEVYSGLNTTTYPSNINYTAPMFIPGFLAPLTSLKYLDIGQTNISSFGVEEFCTLQQLQVLILGYNRLNHTEGLGIECRSSSCNHCLPNVTLLDISGNPINELTANISWNFPSLKELNISHCYLSVLYLNSTISESIELIDARNNRLHSVIMDEEDPCYYPHLRQLHLENNHLHIISPDLFMYMRQLQYLDLSGNALTGETLIGSGLNSLTELKWLVLNHNSIKRLQYALMGNITKLLGLWCQGCNLTTIENNTFISTKNLTNLDLSNNSLSMAESGFLSHSLSLQELNLSGNALNKICLFENLSSLTSPDLSNNMLSEIPDFSGPWANMVFLTMDKNRISHISPRKISGLTKLRYLSLAFNSIESLSDFTFAHQNDLEWLILSNNRIKIISSYGMHTLPSLTWLNLDNNFLTELPPLDHYSLNKLMYLNLSRNLIKTVTMLSYRNAVTSLRGIDFSHNLIVQVKVSIEIFEHLQYMNFCYNRLSKLDVRYFVTNTWPRPNVYLQGNILHIDCHSEWMPDTKKDKMYGQLRDDLREKYGVIRNITTAATPYERELANGIRTSHYVKIPDLDLVQCITYSGERKPFSKISASDFVCKYTVSCQKSDCPMDCCKDFYNCRCTTYCYPECSCYNGQYNVSINFMNCSSRNMTSLGSNGPSYVRSITLDGNNLISIDSASLNFPYLTRLNAANSQIAQIRPGAFHHLKMLQLLQLQQNSIEKIRKKTFAFLINLNELYLHGNKINHIDNGSFDDLLQLKVLTLHSNNLKFIYLSLFGRMYSLMELTLHDNPWSCDCQSGPKFKAWLINSEVIANRSRIYCNTTMSSDLMDMPNSTSSLDDQAVIGIDFAVCTNGSIIKIVYNHTIIDTVYLHKKSITEVVSLVIVFAILVIFTLVIYNNRLLLKVWFYNKYGLHFHKEEDDNDDKPYDVFIAYAKADERLLMQELLPKLEEGEMCYKVCLECRDWQPGATTTDSVVPSVQQSKRTIVLVSPTHMDTQWCEYSFDVAHYRVLKDQQIRLILVLTDIELESRMTPAMKLYMRTNCFLVMGEKWFWEKMRYFLAVNPRGANYDGDREFKLMKVYQ